MERGVREEQNRRSGEKQWSLNWNCGCIGNYRHETAAFKSFSFEFAAVQNIRCCTIDICLFAIPSIQAYETLLCVYDANMELMTTLILIEMKNFNTYCHIIQLYLLNNVLVLCCSCSWRY